MKYVTLKHSILQSLRLLWRFDPFICLTIHLLYIYLCLQGHMIQLHLRRQSRCQLSYGIRILQRYPTKFVKLPDKQRNIRILSQVSHMQQLTPYGKLRESITKQRSRNGQQSIVIVSSQGRTYNIDPSGVTVVQEVLCRSTYIDSYRYSDHQIIISINE